GQTNLPNGLSYVAAIASGDGHCVALRSDGSVVAWGSNFQGETNVPSSLTNGVAVAASGTCNLALRNDGTVTHWASGPTPPSDLTNVVALGTGYSHGIA